MAEKERRIYAGNYKRYDGKYAFVVTVGKDYATQEESVIFYFVDYHNKAEYLTMPKKDFCSKVTYNGKKVNMFTRQTQMWTPEYVWDNIRNDGFEDVRRTKKKEVFTEYYCRSFRLSTDYTAYAKDLCKHFAEDEERHKLCRDNKRYIGISKDDYNIMVEDIRFVTACLNTVLSEYKDYFTERYINGLSVRKYAEKYGVNRGSVEHTERKLIHALASELKRRDDANGKCRLRQDEEE